MSKSQRTAYFALAWVLDALALVFAFIVAVWLREGLGNTLVALSDVFGWHLRDMVRHPKDLPEFYRIVLSPNPLVNIQTHLWVLYLSIPAWLFFCTRKALTIRKVNAAHGRNSPYAVMPA